MYWTLFLTHIPAQGSGHAHTKDVSEPRSSFLGSELSRIPADGITKETLVLSLQTLGLGLALNIRGSVGPTLLNGLVVGVRSDLVFVVKRARLGL